MHSWQQKGKSEKRERPGRAVILCEFVEDVAGDRGGGPDDDEDDYVNGVAAGVGGAAGGAVDVVFDLAVADGEGFGYTEGEQAEAEPFAAELIEKVRIDERPGDDQGEQHVTGGSEAFADIVEREEQDREPNCGTLDDKAFDNVPERQRLF